MTSSTRNLTYNLIGKDVSASATFSKTADAGEKMTARIGSSLQKLGGQVGGELGNILATAGDGFDKLAASGEQFGTKIAAVGAGVTGLGLAVSSMASSEKAAQQQLDAAIVATGGSWSDYSDEIDKAISKGADYGHSSTDVQNAIARLTEGTGDAGKALDNMGLVDDIAAAKHESLSDAANQLTLAMNGNAKVFKQFGINLGTTKPTAEQLQAALDQLAAKLRGQASASADTFDGKIKSITTHLGDWAAEYSGKVAPVLDVIGPTLMVAGAGMDFFAARAAKAALAQAETSTATDVTTVAESKQIITTETLAAQMSELRMAEINAAIANEKLGASAVETTTAETELAVSQREAGASMSAGLGPLGLAVVGVTALGVALDPLANKIGSWVDGQNLAFTSLTKLKGAEDAFTASLEANNGVMDQSTRSDVIKTLQSDGLAKSMAKSGVTLTQLTNAVLSNDKQFQATLKTWQASGQITNDQTIALVALKNTYDVSAQSANDYTTALNANSNAAANATAEMNAYKTALAGISADSNVGDLAPFLASSGKASGGQLSFGASGASLSGWTKVGEYGPELVSPSGRVYPTGQSRQMEDTARSSGGGVVNHFYITMPTVMTPTMQDAQRAAALVQQAVNGGTRLKI